MSFLEIAGFILGVAGVALMIRQNLWAFPISLAQVLVFGWVCYEQKLYSDALLQLLFFAALVHGWWHWTHPGAGRTALPVQALTPMARGGWLAATLVLWLAWGTIMHRQTDAALPYADALVLAVSVAAQWLQARKMIENWPAWVLANTAAIGVFLVKHLFLFAALYAIFWAMALWGWREWRHAMRGVQSRE